jgi:hypothetical protein
MKEEEKEKEEEKRQPETLLEKESQRHAKRQHVGANGLGYEDAAAGPRKSKVQHTKSPQFRSTPTFFSFFFYSPFLSLCVLL